MCDHVFGLDDIPSDAMHAILRLCTVHFENNATRLSRISMCVTPLKASKFCRLCCQILMDICFEKFEDIVNEIQSKFSKCRGWLGWCLDQKRAPHA
jgi:hypothetical protein